jgi:hypothetical protein
MKKKIKCVSISKDTFDNLEEDFQKNLNITELQSYFPIMALFFKVFNSSDKHFTLKTNNYITKINNRINFESNDSYIKNFFECNVKNYNSNTVTNKNVFVKILPILNVTQYMMNEYNITSILPNIHSYLTNKKVNNYHNSAYIDSFFSYLGSNLTESGNCPTFPTYYGTFSGIAEEFKYDVSEEYSMMKNEDWFKIFNNNLFELEKVKLNLNLNRHSSISSISSNSLNLEEPITEHNIPEEPITEDDSIEESKTEESKTEESKTEDNVSEEPITDDNAQEEPALEDNAPEDNALEENESMKVDDFTDNMVNLDDSDLNIDSNSDSNWSDVTSDSDQQSDSEEDYLELKNMKMKKINFDDDNLENEDSSLSSLSASCCSNNSFSSVAENEISYAKLFNFPVQLNCIEMLDKTLDNYLEEEGSIPEEEWKSILFQICFGLAVAQKKYNFVHNDLHSSNIMFKNTNLEYIYFNFKGKYFKVPTFGKITKIIDFGRATFNVNDKIFFSDVFKKNGDAEGQYSYPYTNSLDKCKIKPNKSFDLSRLSTTIIQNFDNDSQIFKLLKLWASDKNGNFLLKYEDDFNLYKIIAKNVVSAVPKNQINKIIFRDFSIEKEEISSNEFVYNY